MEPKYRDTAEQLFYLAEDVKAAGYGAWFLGEILNNRADNGEDLDETETRGVAALVKGLNRIIESAMFEHREYLSHMREVIKANKTAR